MKAGSNAEVVCRGEGGKCNLCMPYWSAKTMFTLDMLEVLLPPPSFCAAREHSIACISMAHGLPPHSPSAPTTSVLRSPTRQVLWKIVCLFPCFHFSSFVSFWFFFSFIFCCSCVCVLFFCVSRPFRCLFICIVVRSCFLFLVAGSTLALALAPASASASASAQLLLSFSWLHLPGPTLPMTALAALSCVLFYLHLFIND